MSHSIVIPIFFVKRVLNIFVVNMVLLFSKKPYLDKQSKGRLHRHLFPALDDTISKIWTME